MQWALWRTRRLSDAAAFGKIFAYLQKSRFFILGAATYRNPFGHNAMTAALIVLVRQFQKENRRPTFELRLANPNLLDRHIEQGRPAIVVTVHDPSDAAINRVLEARQVKWTLLAGEREKVIHKARFLGLQGDLDLVIRSSDALLGLRRKLREGRWITADVDFVEGDDKEGRMPPAISPALFDLALRLQVPLLYLQSRFISPRAIELTFGEPSPGLQCTKGEILAADFVSWLQSQGDKRPWRIGKWQATSDAPAHKSRP